MVDTGAYDHVVGENWTERMEEVRPPEHESQYHDLETQRAVAGVGKQPDVATKSVWMPIGVSTRDGALDTGYSATVLPQSM